MITLDLDKMGTQQLRRIITKIQLRCNPKMSIRYSCTTNGYHVRLECPDSCWVCRFAFDDQKRVTGDYCIRPLSERNVLFSNKECKGYVLSAGDWLPVAELIGEIVPNGSCSHDPVSGQARNS